ncbi:hypothetical protein [Actinomadura luteofluorescens]
MPFSAQRLASDRDLLSAAFLVSFLVLFVGCMVRAGDRSSSSDAGALVTPSEEPSPPAETVDYTVTSVKGRKLDGDKCVAARVKVSNHRRTTLSSGVDTGIPAPFKLVNGRGENVRSATMYLTLAWDIRPVRKAEAASSSARRASPPAAR